MEFDKLFIGEKKNKKKFYTTLKRDHQSSSFLCPFQKNSPIIAEVLVAAAAKKNMKIKELKDGKKC